MIVAKYYGEVKDNFEESTLEIYRNYKEWVNGIKEDFRKFSEYCLCDVKNSEKLKEELKRARLGLNQKREFNTKLETTIFLSDDFIIFDFIIFPEYSNSICRNKVIVSRDYKNFIFVNNDEYGDPETTIYKIENNEVFMERLPYKIDIDSWDSKTLIEENLKVLRGEETSTIELGGFAEYEWDVSGGEKGYNAFNYCLASEYFNAMRSEDFESLGVMDSYLIGNICDWLNYDGVIGSEIVETIKNIPTGEFQTCKGRTFAEAVANRNLDYLADTLIYNGSTFAPLYAIYMINSKDNSINILDDVPLQAKSDLVPFVNYLLYYINKRYIVADEIEQREIVDKVSKYLLTTRYRDLIFTMDNIKTYPWLNGLHKDRHKIVSLTQ